MARRKSENSETSPKPSQKRSRSKSHSRRTATSTTGKLGSGLLWPFRVLRNSWKHWSLLSGLKSLFRNGYRFIVWLVLGDRMPKAMRPAVRRETDLNWPSQKLLRNPMWWGKWTVASAVRWATTRPPRNALLAVPALVFVVGFLSAASWGRKKSANNLEGRYVGHWVRALEADDLATARLAIDRLIQLNPHDPQFLLQRAILEDQQGDKALAKQMMSDLAKYQNSSIAALWLANSLGDRASMREWPKEQLQAYVDWLVTASKNAPDEAQPRLDLSELLTSMGDLRRAYAVLLPLANKDIEIAYRVVAMEDRLGLREQARRRSGPMLNVLQPQLIQSPDNLLLRIRCAELLGFVGRTEEAVSTLRDGMVHTADEAQRSVLEDFLIKAMIRESKRETRLGDASAGILRRLGILAEASKIKSDLPILQQAIIEASIASHAYPDAEVILAREELYQLLPEDKVRFAEGTAALQSGQIGAAKKLLDADATTDSASAGLLNNLAHAILQEDDADLPKALELANSAVKTLPGHPYMRETRGQVLFRLGRYQEAIVDLELALFAAELRADVRPMLAEAYEKTDMPAAAQEQRKLLADEQSQASTPQDQSDASETPGSSGAVKRPDLNEAAK